MSVCAGLSLRKRLPSAERLPDSDMPTGWQQQRATKTSVRLRACRRKSNLKDSQTQVMLLIVWIELELSNVCKMHRNYKKI